jgi:hypothetical protein
MRIDRMKLMARRYAGDVGGRFLIRDQSGRRAPI